MVDDNFLTYPCYFLYTASDGLQCNDVDGLECVCLFMSHDAIRRFHSALYRPQGHVELELGVVYSPAELLERLRGAESRLAAADIYHLVIDPLPGDRVFYVRIRDLIGSLARSQSATT